MNKRTPGNNILPLHGDGIGPEIIEEIIKILNTVSGVFRISFDFYDAGCGGAPIDKEVDPVRILSWSGMWNLVPDRIRMI